MQENDWNQASVGRDAASAAHVSATCTHFMAVALLLRYCASLERPYVLSSARTEASHSWSQF
jgi:hypothetical protein